MKSKIALFVFLSLSMLTARVFSTETSVLQKQAESINSADSSIYPDSIKPDSLKQEALISTYLKDTSHPDSTTFGCELKSRKHAQRSPINPTSQQLRR